MKNNIFKIKAKRQNKKEGFTIMETLVAIFIILLATTGPMVFAQNGLRSAFLSRDQITAFFLAQDAIEYIKNIRDGNMLNTALGRETPWLEGLEKCYEDVGGCSIDTFTESGSGVSLNSIISCQTPNIGCVNDSPDETEDYIPLHIDSTYETYTIADTGNPSLFAREIKITPVTGTSDEVEITVIIRWKSHEGVGVREIVVKENIFNWVRALQGGE